MSDHWEEYGYPVHVAARIAMVHFGVMKPPAKRISVPDPGGGNGGFDDFEADMKGMFPDGGG